MGKERWESDEQKAVYESWGGPNRRLLGKRPIAVDDGVGVWKGVQAPLSSRN